MPPFGLQTVDTHRHSDRRRQRRNKVSTLLDSGVLLFVLVVIAFVCVLSIIPSFLSFTCQILRPHSFRESWDSLNFVLFLFAALCGFHNRGNKNGNNESTSYYDDKNLSSVPQDVQKSYPSTPQGWYEYRQDRTGHSTLTRLRSFRSCPDLRQESLDGGGFYDDTHLNSSHLSNFDQQQQQEEATSLRRRRKKKRENSVENIDWLLSQEHSSSSSFLPPSGNASPLILIRPLPPPWKFAFYGDNVLVQIFSSSRSRSSDLESLEDAASNLESSPMAGVKESCPSRDVNIQADNFIARIRAGFDGP